MKWLTLGWWRYLLGENNNEIGAIRTAICRARNHPCGVWHFNLGLEPDMRCKNCNDDLG
jgi:hypothetical protein